MLLSVLSCRVVVTVLVIRQRCGYSYISSGGLSGWVPRPNFFSVKLPKNATGMVNTYRYISQHIH